MSSRFELVYAEEIKFENPIDALGFKERSFWVFKDTVTGVLYVSDSPCDGALTVMVDADGKPLTEL